MSLQITLSWFKRRSGSGFSCVHALPWIFWGLCMDGHIAMQVRYEARKGDCLYVRFSAYPFKWPCAQHKAIHHKYAYSRARDLDFAPILAAFAPFLLEESAIAKRRREQDDAPDTDREHKGLDLCRISQIGDPDLSSSA